MTYDLSVSGPYHNFSAGNTVVHNSMNEYSGRYSEMVDEFYLPDLEQIQPQSQSNKQGRAGDLSMSNAYAAREFLKSGYEDAFRLYETLLAKHPQSEAGLLFDSDFYEKNGISREIARIILPLANYTEFYWKQNLRNLFHLLHLRQDSHAQWEIRQFANAVLQLTEPHFPMACEAFVDYERDAYTLSRMERKILRNILASSNEWDQFKALANQDAKASAEQWGMSERELQDFITHLESPPT